MQDLSKYKILVVEDDDDSRQILLEFLSIIGFKASGVGEGYTALKKIRASKPDLVFLDIMMPRVNGFIVLKTLKEENIHVNIIVLTALSDLKSVKTASAYEISDYIAKPYKFEELRHKIEKVLNIPLIDKQNENSDLKYSINTDENHIYIVFEGNITYDSLIPVKIELPRTISQLKVEKFKYILDLRDTDPDSFSIQSIDMLFEICYKCGIEYISETRLIVTDEKVKKLIIKSKFGQNAVFVKNKIEVKKSYSE